MWRSFAGRLRVGTLTGRPERAARLGPPGSCDGALCGARRKGLQVDLAVACFGAQLLAVPPKSALEFALAIHTKLVNHAYWLQTGEVAFFHAGPGTPPLLTPHRWQPEPGPGTVLRVCCNDHQLPSFDALTVKDILILHQRVGGVSQVVTHVLRPLNNAPAVATSPWDGWPYERPFEVLARLNPMKFGVGVVGPHGDLVSTQQIVEMRGPLVRLQDLLGWGQPPVVQSGRVFASHGGQQLQALDLRTKITVENGFDMVPNFAGQL